MVECVMESIIIKLILTAADGVLQGGDKHDPPSSNPPAAVLCHNSPEEVT